MSQILATPFARFLARTDLLTIKTIRFLLLYTVPILVGIVSIIALLFWHNSYSTYGERVTPLRVWVQTGDALSNKAPAAVFNQLKDLPPSTGFESKLAEGSIWFSLTTHGQPNSLNVVEFPSRHAIYIGCWDATTSELLGQATHSLSEGALAPIKAGFVLTLLRPEMEIICRGNFVGPARLSAVLWPETQLAKSAQHFHRASGLLDGGMLILAIIVILTAWISRQGIYVLFSVWLILNLRVAELSAGWDMQWLGQEIPASLLLPSRSIAIALNSLVTIHLFITLFCDELKDTLYAILLKITRWFCLFLLPAAFFLSYKTFLPIMWATNSLTLMVIAISIGSILFRLQSRVSLWYAASLAVAALSSLSEIVAASLGMRDYVGIANSVTAALASSLLSAIAIAEQMRQEHLQRLETQAEMQHMVEAMPVGLFTFDNFGRCLSANPTFISMLKNTNARVGDESWKRNFADGSWDRLKKLLEDQTEMEMNMVSKSGDERFLVRATRERDKIQGVLQDVTKTSKATENLMFLANNDPLTKVYNRRGIEQVFIDAHTQLLKGQPLSLAYLDLDRFKLMNDLFGHAAGDEVLKQVCDRITGLLARTHHIGRIGGDEFVLIMPDTTIQLATLIARGIVNSVGDVPFRIKKKAFHIRAAVGLVEVSPDMSMQDAVITADRACREAKDGYANGLGVCEINSNAFVERQEELRIIEKLSSDTATDSLFIEMQPILSLKTPYRSRNVEVLLRMRDDDGKTIPAYRIIAAAEKCGCTSMIDRWVLATTLAWIGENFTELSGMQFICVNLSGESLNDETFLEDAVNMLTQHPDITNRLCIEITESVAVHDPENTRRFINRVRSYGAKVSLDNFGAGYTSFSYLMQLPVEVLKIDGSFIANMNGHPANEAIVETIVMLASNLGMKTIAESVEDAATVETLAEIGVDYVQGFAISASRAPEDILAAESSASFISPGPLAVLVDQLSRNEAPHQATEPPPFGKRRASLYVIDSETS